MDISELDSTTSKPISNGRDYSGRFAKGNAGGPGNPFARQSASVRAMIMRSVTDDDLREITRKLIDLAKAGDIAAAKLIFDRTAGRVADPVDPDWVDINGREIEEVRRTRLESEQRRLAFEERIRGMYRTEEEDDTDAET